MNAFVAKILIVVCLFGITPLKELLKAPLLVMHYVDHNDTSPDMTLKDFLLMHYCSDVKFDDDYAQDQQLPFKSIDFQHLPIFIYYEQSISHIPFHPISQILKVKNLKFDYLFNIKETTLSGVFHPPKIIG
ncbi:MAG: hypothetical protein R2774_06135 [Saprospiraceae bacterium]